MTCADPLAKIGTKNQFGRTRNPESGTEPLPRRPADVRRRFAGRSDQVAAARRFVVDLVGRGSDLGESARLLVSEAATNAVLHSVSGASIT